MKINNTQPLSEGLNEAVEDSLDFINACVERAVVLVRQVPQIASKQNLILDLAGRSCGDTEKTGKVLIATSTATFRNVRCNRGGSSPNLRREAESFVRREAT